MNIPARYASLLDQAIRSSLPLAAAGFDYSGVREAETAALGKYLEATFTHPRTRRKISISYFPEPDQPGTRAALSVVITKDAGDAYSGTFSINNFLEQKGAGERALSALDLTAHEGSARNQVKGVLTEVAKVFGTDLKDVVAGKTWVHVPSDWDGYR